MPSLPATYRFEDFQLDLARYELRRNGHTLKLERIPMELLILLVGRNGELVSRDEIIEKLWGRDVFIETELGINTAVRKIRQTLGDDPERPRFVQTVVGKGYRFVAQVTTPENFNSKASASAPTDLRNNWWTRGFWLLGAAAGIAVLAAVIWVVRLRTGRASTASNGASYYQSIAVLPLANLSGDPSQEYFADGITDALITGLSRISSLRVISRTSAMRYKRSAKPLPEIARDLNVDAVIEGAVIRSGSRVRVTAQLIEAKSDRHLWAGEYDYELRDVLTLQSDASQAIANEIRVKLTPMEQQRLAARHPVNPEALDEYLKGRSFWGQRTEPGLRKAIEHFQSAIGKDPDYAMAYSGLADSYSILGVYTYVSPTEAFPKAKVAALKALLLDDNLAEAHVSLGIVLERLDWDWDGVDRHQRRAIELDPGYATAHHWRSYHLDVMGRFDEGIQEMGLAWRLDPFSLPINTSYGTAFLYARRYDDAMRKYREAEELDPNFILVHSEIARVYSQTGRLDLAISEAQKAAELSNQLPRFVAEVACALALSGQPSKAREILHELKRRSMQRYVSPYDLALIYTALNDKDAAFNSLEGAYRERSAWLPWLNRDPRWDALRSDPRFESLVERIGLRK